MATPVGVKDAKMAIHNAFCEIGGTVAEHRIIPRAIFSDPEIATVGMTAEQAKEKQYKYETRTLPMSHVPRSVLMQHSDGVVKIISDTDTQEILGVTVVGPSAGEVVQQAALGMRLNARLSDLSELIYVYPSIAEGLKLAARREPD
jgi:mercuric reductase